MKIQLHDVDLKLLRVFATIVESGGFSLAQAKLNLSQSAISTYMSQLETRLGFRLCERGHGVFRLTDEGKGVHRAAMKLFDALEEFQSNASSFHKLLRGELRLGVIDNSVTHPDSRVRDALARFRDRAPGVDISIYVGGAIELEESVMDGRLHVAVGLFHHHIEGLEYQYLFDEEHYLYCGHSHPFFGLADDDISMDMATSADYVDWGYLEELETLKLSPPLNAVASTPYMEGVAWLVLTGKYIGFLPAHYAESWVAKGEMRPLLPHVYSRSAKFFTVTRAKSGNMPLSLVEFLSELNGQRASR